MTALSMWYYLTFVYVYVFYLLFYLTFFKVGYTNKITYVGMPAIYIDTDS